MENRVQTPPLDGMLPSQEFIEFNITKQLIPSQNIGSLTYSASVQKISKDSLPSPFLFGHRRITQEMIGLCSIEKEQGAQLNRKYPFKLRLQPVGNLQDGYYQSNFKCQFSGNKKIKEATENSRRMRDEQNQTVTSRQSSVRFADFDAFQDALYFNVLNEIGNKSETGKSLDTKSFNNECKKLKIQAKMASKNSQVFQDKFQSTREVNFKKKRIISPKRQSQRKSKQFTARQHKNQNKGNQMLRIGTSPSKKTKQAIIDQLKVNPLNIVFSTKTRATKSYTTKASKISNGNSTVRGLNRNHQDILLENSQNQRNIWKDQRRIKSKSTSICIRKLSKTKPMLWKPEFQYQLPTASTFSSSVFKFNLSSLSNKTNNSPQKDVNSNYANCYSLNTEINQTSRKINIKDQCKQDLSPDQKGKINFSIRRSSKPILKGVDAKNKQNMYIQKQHLKVFLDKRA